MATRQEFLHEMREGTACDLAAAAISAHPFYSRFAGSSLAAANMNEFFCDELHALAGSSKKLDGLVGRCCGDVTGFATAARAVEPNSPRRGITSPMSTMTAESATSASNSDRERVARWNRQVFASFPEPLLCGLPSATADATLQPGCATWKLRHSVDVSRGGSGGRDATVTHAAMAHAKWVCAQLVWQRYQELMDAQFVGATSSTAGSFCVTLTAPPAIDFEGFSAAANFAPPTVPGSLRVTVRKLPPADYTVAPAAADQSALVDFFMCLFVALANAHAARRLSQTEVVLRCVAGAQGTVRPCVTRITPSNPKHDEGHFYLVPGIVTLETVETLAIALKDLNAQWHRDVAPSGSSSDPLEAKAWQRLVAPVPEPGNPSRVAAMFTAHPLAKECMTSLLQKDLLDHAWTEEKASQARVHAESATQYTVKGTDHGFSRMVFAESWRPEQYLCSPEVEGMFRSSKANPLSWQAAVGALHDVLQVVPAPWPSGTTSLPPKSVGAGGRRGSNAEGDASTSKPISRDGGVRQAANEVVSPTQRPSTRSLRSVVTATAAPLATYPPEVRALFPLSFLEDDHGLSFAERSELRAIGAAYKALESSAAGVAAPPPSLATPTSLEWKASDGWLLPCASLPFPAPESALAFAIAAAKSVVKIHFAASSDNALQRPVLTTFAPDEALPNGRFPLPFDASSTSSTSNADVVPSALQHPLLDPAKPHVSDRFVSSLSPFEERRDALPVLHHSILLSDGAWRDKLFGNGDAISRKQANLCPCAVIIATGASHTALQALLDGCFSGPFVDRLVFVVVDTSVDEAALGCSAVLGPLSKVLIFGWKAAAVDGIAEVWQVLPHGTHRSVFAQDLPQAEVLALLSHAASSVHKADALSLLALTPRASNRTRALSQIASMRRSVGTFVDVPPALLLACVHRVFADYGDSYGNDFDCFWQSTVVPSFSQSKAGQWARWSLLVAKAGTTSARLQQKYGCSSSVPTRGLSMATQLSVRFGGGLTGMGSNASLSLSPASLGPIPQLAAASAAIPALSLPEAVVAPLLHVTLPRTPQPPSLTTSAAGALRSSTADTPARPSSRQRQTQLAPTPGSVVIGTAAGTTMAATGASVNVIDDVEAVNEQQAAWSQAHELLGVLLLM
jgi:hypothetical protein